MPAIQTVITSTKTGTYEKPNDFLGQLLAIMLQCPHVYLISDTGNSATQYRTIFLRFGDNDHQIRLVSSSGGYVISLMNLSGTAVIKSTSSIYVVSNVIRFIYGTSFLLLEIEATKNNTFFGVNINGLGWYSGTYESVSYMRFALYNKQDDVQHLMTDLVHSFLTLDGKFIGIPEYIYKQGFTNLICIVPNFFKINSKIPEGTYSSGGKTYYALNSNMLVCPD